MSDLSNALRPSGTPSPTPIEELAARAERRRRQRRFRTAGALVSTAAVATLAFAGLSNTPQSVTVADGITGETNPSVTSGPATSGPATSGPVTSEPGDDAEADQVGQVPPPTETTTHSPPPDAEPAESTSSTVLSTTETDPGASVPDENSPDSTAGPRPQAAPGLRTMVTTTSTWDNGYCFQIDLVNDTTDAQVWSLNINLDGTVATTWNAVARTDGAGTAVFTGQDGYNTTIEPGALTTFGACVDTD